MTTLQYALAKRGLSESLSTPSSFVAPPGHETSRQGDPYAAKDMHAFSFAPIERTGVAISQRTINETSRTAAFVEGDAFLRSLSPAAQARWLILRK